MKPDRLAFAHRARLLITECRGLESAASACRIGKSQLARACDPNDPDRTYLPVDVVADLEAYCGSPIVSEWLAGLRTAPLAGADLVMESVDVVTSGGRLVEGVREALADGKLSARERAHLLTLFAKTVAELGQVASLLQSGSEPQ